MVKASRIHLVLGDQLSHSLSALADADPETSLVLMAEVMSEATYVKHHKKKIAFLFSAMRHFAEELREEGLAVRYVTLDDPQNTQSLKGELARTLADTGAASVVVTECGEWRLADEMRGWEAALGVPVEIREDDRFLCSIEDFREWRKGRKQLRMEYFYRDMRRRHRVLLEGEEPVGGKWNFDAENRKPPAEGLKGPKRISHTERMRSRSPCWLWSKSASPATWARSTASILP
ncbi:MAG: cryptochrome/photolyase family protein [Rhizobium sp.]|nr:cryptochrome/photolyase family protein [Rhizobium sp.]